MADLRAPGGCYCGYGLDEFRDIFAACGQFYFSYTDYVRPYRFIEYFLQYPHCRFGNDSLEQPVYLPRVYRKDNSAQFLRGYYAVDFICAVCLHRFLYRMADDPDAHADKRAAV